MEWHVEENNERITLTPIFRFMISKEPQDLNEKRLFQKCFKNNEPFWRKVPGQDE